VRRALLPVALVAVFLLPAGAVLAQSAPPAAGTAVTFVDNDGVARGDISVKEVADPFTDFDPRYPPDAGSRYVLLTVIFDANTDQTFDTNPYWVQLRDTSGNLLTQGTVPRPETAVQPELQAQTLAPGNRVSGVIGYVVPEDVKLDDVLYQPESYRFVPLADLTPGPGPLPGTAVPWTSSDGSSASITVNVTDPFTDFAPANPPPDGQRFVALFAEFENSGQVPFRADPNTLFVRDTGGQLYGRGTIYRPEDSPLADLDSQVLSPGDRVSGVIGYVVPADAELVAVDYWPESARISTIADLVAGGAVPQASGAPAPASVAPSASAAASTGP
jgi:hypothetical protein